jgi:hypothetical protein
MEIRSTKGQISGLDTLGLSNWGRGRFSRSPMFIAGASLSDESNRRRVRT